MGQSKSNLNRRARGVRGDFCSCFPLCSSVSPVVEDLTPCVLPKSGHFLRVLSDLCGKRHFFAKIET